MTLVNLTVMLSCISLLAWLYLAIFHHGFWKRREFLPPIDAQNHWPGIISLTPARNEEAVISRSIQSLLSQSYQGQYRAILINDNSEDKTLKQAQSAIDNIDSSHSVDIMNAPALKSGWSGKLWALNHGLEMTRESYRPDYYWLSDADITHDTNTLARLVTLARRNDLGMASLMVTLNCKTFWERLIIPAFIYYFQMLYPFAATANPKSQFAGGAGGCILIRADALEAIGGISAIKDTLIDDCALAKAVKTQSYKIWLGHGTESHSIRESSGLDDLWKMVTRTAFTQLNFSYFKLLGAIFGMFLLYAIPVIVALSGILTQNIPLAVIGASTWGLMALTYAPTVRAYGRSFLASFMMPFTAHLFMAMTLHSAWLHFRGSHSGWRGRIYDNHASQSHD